MSTESADGSQDLGIRYLWDQEHEKEPAPREFRIVVPAAMGEAEVLRRVAEAVQNTRASFVRHAELWSREILGEQAKPQPNPVRIAFGRGQASAYRGAYQHLSEDLLGGLGLWLMQELQDPPTREEARYAAERLGWRVEDRPEIPLSGKLPDAGALVELLRVQRTSFAVFALQMNRMAVVDNAGESPAYEAYLGAARAIAQAADDLEWLLARAFGTDAEYRAFLDEHQTWQARIIESAGGDEDG